MTVAVVYMGLQARKELGMQFTPIETTYQDMAVTMLQLGMATPLSK